MVGAMFYNLYQTLIQKLGFGPVITRDNLHMQSVGLKSQQLQDFYETIPFKLKKMCKKNKKI